MAWHDITGQPLIALMMCRFTLAALEHSDKAEAQRAMALVRRHGGRRFTAQTLHLLQGVDKVNILALCPCSLPKQTVAQPQAWGVFASGKHSSSAMGFCCSKIHLSCQGLQMIFNKPSKLCFAKFCVPPNAAVQ